MPRDLTLGVLSPWLGGWYFGGILRGVVRAGADAGANVVAIQTLDAGTEQLEVQDPPDLEPIALRQVAGFIVVINAAQARSLKAIQDSGRPLVAIGHDFSGIDCPVILSDNRTGIREAVSHLIAHGHRRIAFAGFLGADDVRQRHEAYQETLRAHGITPDPRLLYEADENQQVAGVAVARDMLEAGLPSTAVVVGTDANAMGIMQTLVAAGCRLPRDQAVIGFDDVHAAAYTTPRLSTVRQSFTGLGATAVSALLEQIRGAPGDGRRHEVPTSLVTRESCGCAGMPAHAPADLERSPALDAPERMLETARTVHELGTRATSVAAAHGDLTALHAIAGHAQSTIMALMQAQGQAQFEDRAHLEETLSKQYEISMDLFRGHEEDPRDLRWLARTSADAGCLGLWADPGSPPAHTALEIVGTFSRGPLGQPARGTSLDIERFPPAELMAVAEQRADGLALVVPVKVGGSDWGLFAIADTVDTRVGTGREPVNHWAALLSVALDRRAMLKELHRREEQLRIAALYDDLTGLANRTLFLDRLRQVIGRGRRHPEQRFGVLFVDLDGFKVINDSMGHSTGDKLLVLVAERLTGVLREADTAARYGGDEFLILLDGIDEPHTPTRVAERLHAELARPFHVDGQELVISASIGVAFGAPDHQDAEEVLRDADIAMYAAKSQGKGSHAVFNVGMHLDAVSRLRVETDLRHALERDELEVFYQPVVHLPSGRPTGFEALVRWRHPTRGLLAPEAFLEVAEDTGLIIPFGRWIVDAACRELAAWRSAGHTPGLWMSVNVSRRQFRDETFVADVAAGLRRHGLDPGLLALEMTEGVIADDLERAGDRLRELHELGCRLLVDDFGTGYSSLEALHRLPIDGLKIDRSFIAAVATDTRSRELVRTIVTMTGNLRVELIAEGIESEAERDRLVELGCLYGQGYLLARPLPAHRAGALVSGLPA